MSLFGNSRYISKEDVRTGSILTIQGFVQENVAPQDQPPEHKYVMKFHESSKGLVMKPVLAQQLIMIFQLQAEDQILTHLAGQQITLYNDPSVMMHGKLVGGTRLRAPQAGDIPYSEGAPVQQQPQGFRPDPRQTPPPSTYQQPPQFNQPPQRPAGLPTAPRPPVQPAYPAQPQRPVHPPAPPGYSVPRPPAPVYQQPAPETPPADDVSWTTDGRL